MDRITFFLVLALLAFPVAAQSLHKCVDAKGNMSYQSEPCSGSQQQVWVRDATPEPPPTYEQQRAAQLKQQRDAAESAYLRGLAGRQPTPYSSRATGADLPAYVGKNPNRCEEAKRQRDATLQRVGLKRTFSLLRQLDDMVYEACK